MSSGRKALENHVVDLKEKMRDKNLNPNTKYQMRWQYDNCVRKLSRKSKWG